jgi:hypothetical protein
MNGNKKQSISIIDKHYGNAKDSKRIICDEFKGFRGIYL